MSIQAGERPEATLKVVKTLGRLSKAMDDGWMLGKSTRSGLLRKALLESLWSQISGMLGS